jgi:hypothetical protein
MYKFHAPARPEKSLVATTCPANRQNTAWQGSFIDSKVHVGLNLQKRIAPRAQKRIKTHKWTDLDHARRPCRLPLQKANVESQGGGLQVRR